MGCGHSQERSPAAHGCTTFDCEVCCAFVVCPSMSHTDSVCVCLTRLLGSALYRYVLLHGDYSRPDLQSGFFADWLMGFLVMVCLTTTLFLLTRGTMFDGV